MRNLFAHDGALHDLTIDRFLTGDLSDEEAAAVQGHLDTHPTDRDRVAAAREDLAAPLPPLRDPLHTQDGRLSELTISRLLTGDLSDAEQRRADTHLAANPGEQARVDAAREETAAPLPPLRDPLHAQDGRLSDLSIDRLLTGDLSDAEQRRIDTHLAKNPGEQARVDAVRKETAAPLPPLKKPQRSHLRLVSTPEAPAVEPEAEAEAEAEEPEQSNVVAFPGRTWGAVATVLAIAAALLLVVNPFGSTPGGTGDGPDAFTFKGGLSMTVVRDGAKQEVLSAGAKVAAGDTLGFEVSAKEPGYLMIIGIDGALAPYPAHPSQPGAAVAYQALTSRPVGAAIQMDATPGVERLVAIHCPAAFGYDDVSGALRAAVDGKPAGEAAGVVREGCAQQELWLQKEQP